VTPSAASEPNISPSEEFFPPTSGTSERPSDLSGTT
jgi:hypothetical protein